MTITTVGYEANPKVGFKKKKNLIIFHVQSVLGKLFGSFCALVGVFTITLPIPIGRHPSGRIIKTQISEMEEKKRNASCTSVFSVELEQL